MIEKSVENIECFQRPELQATLEAHFVVLLPPFAARQIAKLLEGNGLLERAMGIEPRFPHANVLMTPKLEFRLGPKRSKIEGAVPASEIK